MNGLQDLIMFRDNLQQPEMSGMDNLRNLQTLTMQSMGSQDYINDPMINAGLMGLPVAQAGFGGFIKSITRIPRSIAKGVGNLAKGLAKNKLARIAIPIAAAYFGGPMLAAKFAKLGTLGAGALAAGGASGLTSLAAGEDLDEAVKQGLITGGTYYLGGKLMGAGGQGPQAGKPIAAGQTTGAGTGGASSAYTGGASDLTGLSYGQAYDPVSMVGNTAAQQAAGVGTSQIPGFTGDIGSATYGGVGEAQAASSALQGPKTIISPESGVNPFQDPGTMQYPGGAQPEIAGTINFPDRAKSALMKGVQFAKDKPLTTALGVSTLLSAAGPQPMQQFTPAQLSSAGITTDFDGQRVVYKNADGEEIDYQTALQMIQQASQSFGPGGERKASGVRLGFERVNPESGSQPLGSVEELGKFAVDNLQQPLLGSQLGGMIDPVLSASGGLIGMSYGGQMPMNNMDVKYKEFSGMVGGRGDGMEDNVYMPIVEGERGQQVATLAVSPKEYVVDANTMSLLGNGNPDEGAEIMDETVKDIRMAATGQKKQQKEIDGLAALNRMRSV